MALRILLLASLLVAALGFARPARACADAGAPNGACNDGGKAWIGCSIHSQCPSPQLCFENVCTCLTKCPFGEECGDRGCFCKDALPAGPNCTYDRGPCPQRGVPGLLDCPGDGCSVASTPSSAGIAGPLVLAILALSQIARWRRR